MPNARAALFVALGLVVHSGLAQCGLQAQPGSGVAGVGAATVSSQTGVRASVEWDPDGSGPLPTLLVVGGSFSTIGGIATENVAAIDLATGQCYPLGAGLPGLGVWSLAVLPANNELIAGGGLTPLGAPGADPVRRWNGTSWQPLGAGMGAGGTVYEMVVLPNGDLVVGGAFVVVPAPINRSVARWDGQTWRPLGPGLDGPVTALAVLPNGDVVAGGTFWFYGATMADQVVRWNGVAWSILGAGSGGSVVRDLAVAPNGDLLVVGQYFAGVARWNGTTWSTIPASAPAEFYSVEALTNGDVLVGGYLLTGLTGSARTRVARWDGTSWSEVAALARPTSPGTVLHLCLLANGDVVAGGSFSELGGAGAAGIARWSAGVWSACVPGTNTAIEHIVERANGERIAVGGFQQIDGVPANSVARFDGFGWWPLGTGVNDRVEAVLEAQNGEIWVGGAFTAAGTTSARGLARWNGAAWVGFPGFDGWVHDLIELPNGEIVVAGALSVTVPGGAATSGVARWNGQSWSGYGQGLNGLVRSIAVGFGGDVYAAGQLGLPGASTSVSVAVWNGAWAAVGSLLGVQVQELAIRPNGELLAFCDAGSVTPCVWRWDGVAWSSLGTGLTGTAYGMLTLPNDDIVACGALQVGGVFTGMARWDGAAWSVYGPAANRSVSSLTMSASGSLLATGAFTAIGGNVAAFLARLDPPCLATAISVGVGCHSSGGQVHMVAQNRPWLGSIFRALTTGVPNQALVIALRGLSPAAISLPALVPATGAGCRLLANPDLIEPYVPTAGSIVTTLAIPNAPALVGAMLYHQVLPVELGAAGTLQALTSSNAMALTIGTL